MNSFHQRMLDLSFPFYNRKDFTIQHRLGSGYIGEVFSGVLDIYGDEIDCVIKKVSSNDYHKGVKDREFYDDVIKEVDIGCRFMSKSDHQIQFYGYSTHKKGLTHSIYLLMEKTTAKGDFQEYIYDDSFWLSLSEMEYNKSSSNTLLSHEGSYMDYIQPNKDKLNLIYQMCLAVQDIHSFHIVHCDLKPNNMLYTGSKVKLIDFNASQYMKHETVISGTVEMGTPGYMALELYEGIISYQADTYSVGVSMLEIWFGDIWPRKSDDYNENHGYVKDYLSLLDKDHPELHKLVKVCVSTDYKKRPLIKEVLSNLDRILESQEIVE